MTQKKLDAVVLVNVSLTDSLHNLQSAAWGLVEAIAWGATLKKPKIRVTDELRANLSRVVQDMDAPNSLFDAYENAPRYSFLKRYSASDLLHIFQETFDGMLTVDLRIILAVNEDNDFDSFWFYGATPGPLFAKFVEDMIVFLDGWTVKNQPSVEAQSKAKERERKAKINAAKKLLTEAGFEVKTKKTTK